MTSITYIRYNLTSKDLAIIRQHFCNDDIIRFLWENKTEEAKSKVDKWLEEMVELMIKQPSDKLMNKLTACCSDYPHCGHAQPVAQPVGGVNPTTDNSITFNPKPKVVKQTLTNNYDRNGDEIPF